MTAPLDVYGAPLAGLEAIRTLACDEHEDQVLLAAENVSIQAAEDHRVDVAQRLAAVHDTLRSLPTERPTARAAAALLRAVGKRLPAVSERVAREQARSRHLGRFAREMEDEIARAILRHPTGAMLSNARTTARFLANTLWAVCAAEQRSPPSRGRASLTDRSILTESSTALWKRPSHGAQLIAEFVLHLETYDYVGSRRVPDTVQGAIAFLDAFARRDWQAEPAVRDELMRALDVLHAIIYVYMRTLMRSHPAVPTVPASGLPGMPDRELDSPLARHAWLSSLYDKVRAIGDRGRHRQGSGVTRQSGLTPTGVDSDRQFRRQESHEFVSEVVLNHPDLTRVPDAPLRRAVPHVSGHSGSLAFFLPAAHCAGVATRGRLRHQTLLSAAFMVRAGWHSFHETFITAARLFGVCSYPRDPRAQGCYQSVFSQLHRDADFAAAHGAAWERLIGIATQLYWRAEL